MSRTIHKKIEKIGKYRVEIKIMEVRVKNGHKAIKAFARILKPKKVYAYDNNDYLAEVKDEDKKPRKKNKGNNKRA